NVGVPTAPSARGDDARQDEHIGLGVCCQHAIEGLRAEKGHGGIQCECTSELLQADVVVNLARYPTAGNLTTDGMTGIAEQRTRSQEILEPLLLDQAPYR